MENCLGTYYNYLVDTRLPFIGCSGAPRYFPLCQIGSQTDFGLKGMHPRFCYLGSSLNNCLFAVTRATP